MSTLSTSQPTRQFGRALRLEVGNDSEGILIENLRVTFDIQKGNVKHPNKATITIFNLKESNRYKLATKVWTYARLSVGYGLSNITYQLIFEGNITRVNDQRNGMDIQTVFECGDGREAFTNSFVSTTMAKGATYDDVIDECLGQMDGIQEGYISVDKDTAFTRGRTLYGQVSNVLDGVAKANNAVWSIQDGKLTIIPNDAVNDSDAIILSASSGMIGAPKGTDKGLEVSANLNPTFSIGGLIQVDSMFTQYNGQYKIDTVRFRGDNHPKGPWAADLTLLGGEFAKKLRRTKKPKKPKKPVTYIYSTDVGDTGVRG